MIHLRNVKRGESERWKEQRGLRRGNDERTEGGVINWSLWSTVIIWGEETIREIGGKKGGWGEMINGKWGNVMIREKHAWTKIYIRGKRKKGGKNQSKKKKVGRVGTEILFSVTIIRVQLTIWSKDDDQWPVVFWKNYQNCVGHDDMGVCQWT